MGSPRLPSTADPAKRRELSRTLYEKNLRRSLKRELRVTEAQRKEKQFSQANDFREPPKTKSNKPYESDYRFYQRMDYVKKLLINTDDTPRHRMRTTKCWTVLQVLPGKSMREKKK